ncbi:hypothetical protein D9758_001489 [Tetrapyrgos nigripes]|uniref:Nitrate reductase n=1 Tax=Tetrapyrgos nigripes TaxID=182062 RepID=A0A8H5GY62_9AGAR|nr:hypothetical protein D9758_001489 [Tetrapyrgos nigripes]
MDESPALPDCLPSLPKNVTPTKVASADSQTPDSWVKRNAELIRLTGKHPFNCEAPLTSLYNAGFLTPAHLHFVRNHGAVPHVLKDVADNWKIRIHGLVKEEVALSITDLRRLFTVVTLPVTLVCAGNRRKEQNVVRKSLGFNWGSAGVSTALWTGVYLADVLSYVGADRRRAKHVIFEGGDSLPNGPYGTSERYSWASSKEKGMLIAWAMNGLPLEPDHGFPVRIIIPGQIGGRSVKWLKSIEVSVSESQHHLHYFDNRILPIQLSPEQARAEKQWWYDSRYLINELNVNSAIAKPAHGEELRVISLDAIYELRGYAYSGGGRRITRVEVSLDDGRTWKLSEIVYPEDSYRDIVHSDDTYGVLDLTERDTCFCWCFWSFNVPVQDLTEASCLTLRAMDESGNMQPRDMYTNATSMINNWWFRVAIVKCKDDTGCAVLRFEHPAPVGVTSKGWMERLKDESLDVLRPIFDSAGAKVEKPSTEGTAAATPTPTVKWTKPGVDRQISLEEFEEHAKEKCWFSISGEVYDASEYLSEHPGGEDSILLVRGEDATDDFMAIHSIDAKEKLRQYHIGSLPSASKKTTSSETSKSTSDDPSTPFLNPKQWKKLKLTDIVQSNYNSFTFHFGLEHSDQTLGLPVGQHVFLRLKSKQTGEMVQRAYTPISRSDEKGRITFLIKVYFPSPQFPKGGKMTMCFYGLVVGDDIEVKGPFGSFVWDGKATAMYKGVSRPVKEIGMVCGGSGITPILQVLTSVLNGLSAGAEICVWLIYANRTEEDILCRQQLESFLEQAPKQFRLFHTLSTVAGISKDWGYGKGKIDEIMLRKHLPAPSTNGIILACGPDAMISKTLKPCLQKIGWDVGSALVVF